MSLIPFRINPDLLQYFYRDFSGEEDRYAGTVVKSISISQGSILGKMILSQLRRMEYPVKNITSFNLYLKLDGLDGLFWEGEGELFKVNRNRKSYLALPEDAITEINQMMDAIFRQNFFYYVEGYSLSHEGKISSAINSFMDRYDLHITHYNYEQLRRLYYRMKDDLPGSRLNESYKFSLFTDK